MEVRLAWYPAGDLDKAKEFYGNVLGLKQVFEMEGWAGFAHAPKATSSGVSANPSHRGRNGATVVLKVDKLDQTRSRLEGNGVQFEGDTEETLGVVRIATFRDPFGNPLQLVQELME